MAVSIPKGLRTACRGNREATAWLECLPAAVAELADRWQIEVGPPLDEQGGTCSWVAPAECADGTPSILKLGMPHMEGLHELHGLRFWAGDPTVLLLEFDVGLNAMLLERCEPGAALRTLPEADQDVVIAGLLHRLWRTPSELAPFRPLSVMLTHWAQEARVASHRWPDAGLVRAGLRLFEELPLSASARTLLATDLHAGNVLSAKRRPWLVIDPKPFVGDPAFDATQHLLNCVERVGRQRDETIQRFADLLELEAERVRLWTFARAAAAPWDDWKGEGWLSLARTLAP
jgi:streptomycin 6-kinase